ncbi:MAG TPA: NYN domain-containing protein [Micromonospora sp.]
MTGTAGGVGVERAGVRRHGRLAAVVRPVLRWWSGWPTWAGWAAALWSLCYGALGLYWTLGGPGFPFGRENDWEADHVLSILADATVRVGGPVVALLGLLSTVVAVVMTRGRGSGAIRTALLTFGWTLAAVLAVLIPDFRLLMLLTRVPFILLAPFFGMPGGHGVADFLPWTRVNLLVMVIGGALWAMAALAYQRRTSGACGNCGRDGRVASWTTPDSARRWGTWAVVVAALSPTFYAATRIAWAMGITWGISDRFYRENVDSGMFLGGLAIAAMAIGGAGLTLGLVQRWGEIFPRWIWFMKGRPVPPPMAIIPASVVSVFVMSAGIMEVRWAFIRGVDPDGWALTGPGWAWPLWGLALGLATYAYYLRRRTACQHCGLGPTPDRSAEPATQSKARGEEPASIS